MTDTKATERAAIAAAALANGKTMTAKELARKTQCSVRSAQRTMEVVSRVLPVRKTGGRWRKSDTI